MPDICAVVVTFNRKELLLECLDALLKQTYPLNRIYLIDNDSSDGTYELLHVRGYLDNPRIAYEKLQMNLGGAGGFAHGLQKAYKNNHDFYYLLDDDAEPAPDAIERLVPYLNKEHSAFASAVYGNFELHETSHRGNFDWCNIYPTPQKALPLKEYEKESVEIDMASFVGILIAKDSIANIGFPRAEFFIHFDDTEYCMRLSKLSKILMIPQSVIYHKEKRQEEKIQKSFLWFKKNRIRYDKLWIKYFGKRNSIYLATHYSTCKAKFYTKLLLEYLQLIKDILLYDDNKLKRIYFSTASYIDGLSGIFQNHNIKEILNSKSPFFYTTNILSNKSVYIAPYNSLSIDFQKSIQKNPTIHFINYLDNYNPEYHYKASHLDPSDFIIIASPNYYKQINETLIKNGINTTKILYLVYDPKEDLFLLVKSKLVYRFLNFYLLFKERFDVNYLRLLSYKNKHKNQRAFIIGNGPSLQISDLTMLQNEITFAANKIYLSFNDTPWRPTYYFVEDNLVYIQNFEQIDKLKLIKFFPSRLIRLKQKIENGTYFNLKYENFYPNQPQFGTNPLFEFYWGSTIVYTMIQFASYMGIKEIYLIGLDFDFDVPNHQSNQQEIKSDGEINHFHKDYRKQGEIWNKPNLEIQEKSFQKVKEFCSQNNIKLYNASRKTKLDILEKVDFDSLITNNSSIEGKLC